MLKIVVDENLADYLRVFEPFGSLTALPGGRITRSTIQRADVLIVRSVTRIDKELLHGTSIRFVGSATAGIDHVDTEYLERNKITFRYAPGSNAESVAEYVTAALVRLGAITDSPLAGKSIGVVGFGHTGSRVARRARALGMTTVVTDPPLAQRGIASLASLSDALECDCISLHVPLTLVSKHPTFHLLDRNALARIKSTSWLINASRGAVVDGNALLDVLDYKDPTLERGPRVVLDVWEGEPSPDSALIRAVDFASPHVAGYSFDGKLSGSTMIAEGLHDWIDSGLVFDSAFVDSQTSDESPVDEKETTMIRPRRSTYGSVEQLLDDLCTQMFDLSVDHEAMRSLANLGEVQRARAFVQLRKEYRRRRSFRSFAVQESELPIDEFPAISTTIKDALGCRLF